MTTATATQDTKPDTHVKTKARNRKRWESARTYVFAALIVFWCLLPAYWMVVTAFRDVGFTYDSTPFFSHVTLDNFRAAFSTDTGNHLTRALINSLIVGVITTVISLLFGILRRMRWHALTSAPSTWSWGSSWPPRCSPAWRW